MLILAGVSISTLTGNNGILTQANEAKNATEKASDDEMLDLHLISTKLENEKIGEKLYDKTFENGTRWNIWIDDEKVYGDGWYYINKDTEIEGYGKTKNEWLINYDTDEKVVVDDEFLNLSYSSSLAVTEGLVFNADPLNMSNANDWGENVILNGFDSNSGWQENCILFDGVDDYIQVKGNLDVSDEITLEFYGKVNNSSDDKFKFVPLFGAYNGKNANTEGLTMRIFFNNGKFSSNFGYVSCGNSNIWENAEAQQNLVVKSNFSFNTEKMYTCTFKHSTNMYSVYENGNLIKEEALDNSYWENFKNNEIPSIEYFQIGKVRWNSITSYLDGEVYSIRIYNKCLTSEQVKDNYLTTKTYHELNS